VICAHCGADKPEAEFNPSKGVYFCRSCRNERTNTWRTHTLTGRANQLFENAKQRSRTAGLPITITRDWVAGALSSGRCAVTNIAFESRGPFAASLDRIDPSQGYTEENVQVVCWIYNRAKNKDDHEAVLKLARALCQNN
jgi:hypothetical protein